MSVTLKGPVIWRITMFAATCNKQFCGKYMHVERGDGIVSIAYRFLSFCCH